MSFLKMEFAKTPSSQLISYTMPQESKTSLYPVLTAESLLAHPKRRLIVEKIKKNCGLDPRYFDMCYESLINQFLELAQALPFQPGGGPGTLMDYGLERAELILQIYREEAGEQFDPKHAYAVVISALLQDIGKVVSNQKVIIADRLGNFIAHWTPFEGSLVGRGDFYRLHFFENQWVTLGKEVTALLARQVIPPIGLIWLAQDNRVLQMLLGALTEDAAAGGDIYRWLQLAYKRLQGRPPKDHLPPLRIDTIIPQEVELGLAFVSWLNRGLEEGSILIDKPDACVYMLDTGGVFLECPRLFRYFCDAYEQRVEWMVACKQFIALGLTTTPVGTLNFAQYSFKYTKKGPEVSYIAHIFQTQNKQRATFKDSTNSKASQAKTREGLVIPPENISLFYKNAATLKPVAPQLQPVEPVSSRQLLAQNSLSLLSEQHAAIKQFTQGKTS